jgi:transcriptional regulator with XRE-family HTH domain
VGARMSGTSAPAASIDEVVRFLTDVLGRPLLARTVGVNRRTLASWLRGTSSPSARSRERLRGALAIWHIVAEIEAPEVVRAWFMGMKDALDDYSPAEVIAEGRIDEVAAVARAYLQRS